MRPASKVGLADFGFFIFLLTVFLSGMVLQQEFLHMSISENMGCSTQLIGPDLSKGFVVAVENTCTGLTDREMLHLRTRQSMVDTVFYGLNLLTIPLTVLVYKQLVPSENP